MVFHDSWTPENSISPHANFSQSSGKLNRHGTRVTIESLCGMWNSIPFLNTALLLVYEY